MNLYKFFTGNNRGLNHITRFSTTLRTYGESVAAHSYYVTLYTSVICDVLLQNNVHVDKLSAITKALVHDVSESVSGDIIRIFKKDMPEAWYELESVAAEKTFEHLDEELKAEYMDSWEKMFDGLEGVVVRVADN